MSLSDREERIFADIRRQAAHAESVQVRRAALSSFAVLVLGSAPIGWALTIAPWAATATLLLVLGAAFVLAKAMLDGAQWSRPRRSAIRTRRSPRAGGGPP